MQSATSRGEVLHWQSNLIPSSGSVCDHAGTQFATWPHSRLQFVSPLTNCEISLTLDRKVTAMSGSSWFSKMFGNAMTLDNLENVLVLQLRDLASAEEQLIDALPKMAEAAWSSELKSAFSMHLAETRRQRTRLDEAFRLLGLEPETETCDAMKGLIAEGDEIISLDGDPEVKDAALIAAAQRVEHYEIAGYGCARTFARQLGLHDVAALLQASLDEESNADKILTEIAESQVNLAASRS
jgi:ferritin-like metal-binding protein YciE